MSGRQLHRVVVVGNGIAGLTACDTLRAEGYDGELIVVGAENRAAYSRPALSKSVLNLGEDLGTHELPGSTHGATELRGVSATDLDPDAQQVTLSDATMLPYDGLVVACGSRARKLTDSSHEFTLREFDDAIAIRNALVGRPRVVVVGGGALGMEIASGAVAAGCETTLVATAPPMSKHLGPHLGATLAAAAIAAGVGVRVATRVEAASSEDHIQIFADGVPVLADVVISAVGDVPNLEWLSRSGLLSGGALVTDERGCVRPEIVAAGDVAAWYDHGCRRTPLWTSAIEQAKVAASALLRGDGVHGLSFQPYFWTEQFGLSVKAVGPLPVAGDPEVLESDPDSSSALLRWTHPTREHTVVAVNLRVPIPRLRRLAAAVA